MDGGSVSASTLWSAALKRGWENMRMTSASMAAALACCASVAAAEQLDRKAILDMLPCRSAALRLCDRSQGIDAAALWRCGATLAQRQHEVSARCVDVLKRYGQL
jgi:hypothetical protein